MTFRVLGPSAAAGVLALVASARVAAADPSTTELDVVSWTAPAGCPGASAVRADVARLGGSARPGVRATVTVAGAQSTRWIASIVLEDGDARRARSLEAKSCAALAEATALVVAMAMRAAPEEDERRTDTPLAPAAPPRVAPVPAGAAEPPAAADRPRATRSSSAFAVGVGAFGIAGALPSAAPAFGGFVAWLPGRARLELAAYATPAQSALAPNTTLGAELQMLGASARACWMAFASPRLEIGPCAGAEAVRISSVGVGITAPRDAVTWGSAGALGVLAAIEMDARIALTLSGDALAPAARPRFVLDGEPLTVLHRPAPLWGRALLGGEIRF